MEICQGLITKKGLAMSTIIAKRTGVSRVYVRKIMNGERPVRSEKSRRVAAEINRIAEFLELTNNNNDHENNQAQHQRVEGDLDNN